MHAYLSFPRNLDGQECFKTCIPVLGSVELEFRLQLIAQQYVLACCLGIAATPKLFREYSSGTLHAKENGGPRIA